MIRAQCFAADVAVTMSDSKTFARSFFGGFMSNIDVKQVLNFITLMSG